MISPVSGRTRAFTFLRARTPVTDHSGLRLITGECDKTVKIYKEDPNATEETHPLDWKAPGRS